MKFCTNSKTCVNLNTGCDDKTIREVETTNFLTLRIDSNLNCKTHSVYSIQHIQYIISKLSSAYFAVRTITSLIKIGNLKKLVCSAYFIPSCQVE
jgi:hypothetical protein